MFLKMLLALYAVEDKLIILKGLHFRVRMINRIYSMGWEEDWLESFLSSVIL